MSAFVQQVSIYWSRLLTSRSWAGWWTFRSEYIWRQKEQQKANIVIRWFMFKLFVIISSSVARLGVIVTSTARHKSPPTWSRRGKTGHSQLSMSPMGPLSTPWSVEETQQDGQVSGRLDVHTVNSENQSKQPHHPFEWQPTVVWSTCVGSKAVYTRESFF